MQILGFELTILRLDLFIFSLEHFNRTFVFLGSLPFSLYYLGESY